MWRVCIQDRCVHRRHWAHSTQGCKHNLLRFRNGHEIREKPKNEIGYEVANNPKSRDFEAQGYNRPVRTRWCSHAGVLRARGTPHIPGGREHPEIGLGTPTDHTIAKSLSAFFWTPTLISAPKQQFNIMAVGSVTDPGGFPLADATPGLLQRPKKTSIQTINVSSRILMMIIVRPIFWN